MMTTRFLVLIGFDGDAFSQRELDTKEPNVPPPEAKRANRPELRLHALNMLLAINTCDAAALKPYGGALFLFFCSFYTYFFAGWLGVRNNPGTLNLPHNPPYHISYPPKKQINK